MNISQEDKHSRFKLAQLWHIVNNTFRLAQKTCKHNRVVNEILKDEFNINYKVTIIPNLQVHKIHLKDCTALHFLYYDVYDICTFNTLIDRGADYTIKNGNGQTVLHLIMKQWRNLDTQKEIPFINSILSAHVKFQNFVNPRDDNGFSHLHAACMVDHIEAVKLFLENGASVDESVNHDASPFAGYTPLHFAMRFRSFKVAQTLVNRQANVNVKDAEGKSPLDQLLENKMVDRPSQVEVAEKASMVKFLLEKGAVSTVGLSSLHIVCAFKDLIMAEKLLNQGVDINYAVPIKSSICPGDTALHFAAVKSIEAVKMLLTRGAKIDFVNVRGLTPLDYCIENYSLQDLSNILSCTNDLKEIRLSHGETRLLDLIAAMSDLDQFKSFMENKIKDITASISGDSVLWPGYTILHLAVTLSKKREYDQHKHFDITIVEECLNRGLSVNDQDIKGQTPIHLAFSQGKDGIVGLFLKHLDRLDHLANLVDEDNLSYLHIACGMKDESLVEKLLTVSDPNIHYKGQSKLVIVAGSTPLHVATYKGSYTIVKMLLNQGANLHATDADGLTPIHWLIQYSMSPIGGNGIVKVLFDWLLTDPEDRVVDGLGVSYLHIACFFGNVQVVEKLLDAGSNVNAVIKYKPKSYPILNQTFMFFEEYSDYTPLLIADKAGNVNAELLNLLLRRGADVFVEARNSLCGSRHSFYTCDNPIENRIILNLFFRVLRDHDDLQKCMKQRLRLTKLHIACYLKDEEAVKSALNDGIDVNVKMHADSVIFAGCTPMHLLVTTMPMPVTEEMFNYHMAQFTIGNVINLLLDRGADVTIANAEKDTPIHLLYKHSSGFIDGNHSMELLLNAQQNCQNVSINPVNAEGISHFHLACLWRKLDIVKKFLQDCCVDVNRPTSCFTKFSVHYNGGSTPLHLALSSWMGQDDDDIGEWTKSSKLVDLLLKHGADVSAKDVHGDTPLHKRAALCSPDMKIFEKLVSYGGDVNSKNIEDQTPIEIMPDVPKRNANSSDYITVFKKYGHKINSWNRLTGEGHVAKIFILHTRNLSENSDFKEFMKSSDVRTIDNDSRTVIHNVVAISEDSNTGNINNYIYAIESFTKIGIDINHQDKMGQTALHYAAQLENVTGVEALLACGADINIVDNSRNSTFSYAVKNSESNNNLCFCISKNVTTVLRLHIKKLQHLGIEVSQLNQNLVKKIQHFFDEQIDTYYGENLKNLSQIFFSQVEMTKTLDIGTHSLTLFGFLSETGAINSYPLLSSFQRDIVDEFVESIDTNQLVELNGIIKLQLKKMTTRLELIDSALISLKTLLGFSVPGLCEQICRFLLNYDLKNLIESITLKSRKRKLSEITN